MTATRRHPSSLPTLAALSIALAACGGELADDEIRKSQHATVSQTIASTVVTIVYSRPVARGRTLFGPDGIVKYGEPWNPGANQATAIGFNRDIIVNGQVLPAGQYSLWAIPGPGEWTIIFSRAADVFHVPYPGAEKDALRISVQPETGAHMETLAYYFPFVDGREAVLRLHWGTTIVPLTIRAP